MLQTNFGFSASADSAVLPGVGGDARGDGANLSI
jgi:hypothetical protein